jgi:hypothetical protein
MDPQTLELLRCLQSGPYDEPAWKHHRDLLRTQRRVLRAQNDSSTLTDIVHLLDVWSNNCESPRTGADVLREAADVAERDLGQTALAADLRKRAVALGHQESRGAATTSAETGKRRKDMKDLNEAIETYEAKLDEDADMETVYHLAELYSQRGNPGDAQQAADLYATLGDLLGHPAGLPMLQRALEHVPDHAEARRLLSQYENAPAAQPSAATPAQAEPPRSAGDRQSPGTVAQSSVPDAELGPAPSTQPRPSAASLRARTQPKSLRPSNADRALRATTNDSRARLVTPVYGGGPPGPIEHKAPRLSTPAPAGGDPRKTTPGLAPTTVQANLASGGKSFGTAPSEARQGNTAQAMKAEAIAPEPAAAEPAAEPAPEPAPKAPPALRVAKAAPIAPAPSGKAPPPLRAAERRAAGQLPAPHPAPVITIVHSAQQPPAPAGAGATPASREPESQTAASAAPATSAAPSATSLNPSGTSAPVTSLSPVVTDDDALERSRARLSATRARKRKLAAGAAAAVAVAVVAIGLIAPRNLQDAQQMAKQIFGGDREQATSAAASRPAGDGRDTSTDTNASTATSTGTTEEKPTSAAATPAPDSVKPVEITAPVPKEPATTAAKEEPAKEAPATNETPASPAPGVHALLEQINLRGGTIKEAQLSAALEKLSPKLDQCYATALEKKPRLKGRLIFQWNVKLNGKVAAAKKQGGTIKDAELARCSIEAIATTKFPKPKKQAAQIRLPFEYKKS